MSETTCPQCGVELPRRRDLGMHNRTIHADDALYLHNDPDETSQ